MGVRELQVDETIKCRCRGSNSECLYCFGSGVITPSNKLEIPNADFKRQAKLPSISILDPSFTQRPGKLSMEQAIVSHGSINGNHNIAQTVARTVRIIKNLRDADPSIIGPHANALLETIRKSLNFDKQSFCKFIQGMRIIAVDNGISCHEKAKQLTIRSALLQGSLKFTASQVAVMDQAFRLASNDIDLNQEIITEQHLSTLQSLIKSLEPKPKTSAPVAVPYGKSGLVLVSPDDCLSDGQIRKFQKRLNSRKVDHVYFIGSDEGFGDFEAKFTNISSLHVKTDEELKSVMKSSSVSTLRLASENIEFEKNLTLQETDKSACQIAGTCASN